MTFADALAILRKGGHVYRTAWGGPRSQWHVGPHEGTPVLSILSPQGNGEKPTYAETIILRNEIGEAYVWGPGQASILAEDWEVMFESEGAKQE